MRHLASAVRAGACLEPLRCSMWIDRAWLPGSIRCSCCEAALDVANTLLLPMPSLLTRRTPMSALAAAVLPRRTDAAGKDGR